MVANPDVDSEPVGGNSLLIGRWNFVAIWYPAQGDESD